jgi:hypothetical protein
MARFLDWGDVWLCGFVRYRRWRGGHWENWMIAECGNLWFRLPECSKGRERPLPICRGQPTCWEENLLDRLARSI